MNNVQVLYELTSEMYQLLQQLPTKDERDILIDKITTFIEKRGALIKEFKAPYTDEELKLGAEIVKMNTFIDSQFDQLKQHIQQDIRSFKIKKQSRKKYSNPYQSLETHDGIFYDKRK